MRSIDELHLEQPIAVARMLQREGHEIGRPHIGTLMARIGAEITWNDALASVTQWSRRRSIVADNDGI
ncbi:MAG: hypothetical protein B7X46_04475 [Thiomonas sp. 15-66-11]|jgi:hypothetical protein|nr:MAG: hypothetical protein B7X46_04475 [Thiomonas sp. 15-66-11]